MNRVILIGRLTRDPQVEEKYTRMNIAVNRRTKSEAGHDADYINLVAFGKTAEIMGKHLSKGSQVGIEGRIQTGSYEKNGQKVFTTDVIVDAFDFIGSKADRIVDTEATQQYKQNEFPDVLEDDGLPFN